MSGGTVVPRHECPGGHFFQGDSHASDTGLTTKPFAMNYNKIVTLSLFASYSFMAEGVGRKDHTQNTQRLPRIAIQTTSYIGKSLKYPRGDPRAGALQQNCPSIRAM